MTLVREQIDKSICKIDEKGKHLESCSLRSHKIMNNQISDIVQQGATQLLINIKKRKCLGNRKAQRKCCVQRKYKSGKATVAFNNFI